MQTFKCSGALSLDNLNLVVAQNEPVLGALAALSNNGQDTLLSFSMGAPVKTDKVAQLEVVAGAPPAKEGYEVVCSGNGLVQTQIKTLAAYRKKT